MQVLFEVPEGASWQEAEIEQIALHRAQGHRLTNSTAGGEGAVITCPIIREKSRQASIRAHARPEVKAKDSANSVANWARPEYREKHAAAMQAAFLRPEVKAVKSAASIKLWEDPEYKAAMSAKHKAINSDPEYVASRIAKAAESNKKPSVRAQRSASAKAANSRPDVLEKNRLKQLEKWQDPAYRAKQSEARKASWARRRAEGKLPVASDEERAKRSAVSKALWEDPDFVQKIKSKEAQRVAGIKASWTPEKREAYAAVLESRRAKMLEAFRAPEVQAKRAEDIRRRWLEKNAHLSPADLAKALAKNDKKRAKRQAAKAALAQTES